MVALGEETGGCEETEREREIDRERLLAGSGDLIEMRLQVSAEGRHKDTASLIANRFCCSSGTQEKLLAVSERREEGC